MALVLLMLVAGCGEDDPPAGPGDTLLVTLDAAPADMGAAPDADAPDSGVATGGDAEVFDDAATGDVGGAEDASSPDAAVVDADMVDASDAGSVDATQVDDAGAADAADAAVSPDAVVTDAGAPDSGGIIVADTGPRPDGGMVMSGGPCMSSRDCVAPEVCGRLRAIGGMITTTCTSTRGPPAGPIGSTCLNDINCSDGICLDDVNNECSVICQDSALDCPAGFECVGYSFNPGPVTISACTRACRRNADCAGGAAGNVCSTQVFERNGSWQLSRICEEPSGPNELGQPCTGGNDCLSGICLTSSRGSCTGNAGCDPDETCQCGDGSAPPCAGGAGATCISTGCTSPCVTPADCVSNFLGNRLTTCSSSVTFTLPDGTRAPILTCTRP